MAPRMNLHQILLAIPGINKVYFQPPESIKLEYPCIVYERGRASTRFADDKPYHYRKRYILTVIDRNPDSAIPDVVATLPMCTHDRFYAAEQLNHDVFTIYY